MLAFLSLSVSFVFACSACAFQMFWATERPHVLFCLYTADDSLSFSLLLLLIFATLVSLDSEHFVPLHHYLAHKLSRCGSSPLHPASLRLHWVPRSIFRQSLLFLSIHGSMAYERDYCTSRFGFWPRLAFVRLYQIGCLLCAVMFWLRVRVEKLFSFSFVPVEVSTP